MENGKCYIHGGRSLRGIASPTFKDGRYSKYVPRAISSRFEESLKDPNLLELRADIALTDARLEDLLKRVETGESGELWNTVRSSWMDALSAIGSGVSDVQNPSFERLTTLIDRGISDYAVWGEIHRLIDNRRRLVESERKRLVEAQQFVTAEQAMVLVSALLGLIKENVTDRDTLQAIQIGVSRLIAGSNG